MKSTNRSLNISSHIVILVMYMGICEICRSKNGVKKGFRHNASGKKQIYFIG